MAERAERGAVARQIFLGSMMSTFGGARSPASSAGAKHLAAAMRELWAPKGTVIYRAGGAPERIYFVVRGKVRLVAEGQPDWVFEDRAVLGIIDANLERPHARTAIAEEDAELLWIPADDYFETLEDNFEQVRAVTYGLCAGLRNLVLELAPDGGFPRLDGAPAPATAEPLGAVERLLGLRSAPIFARASIQSLTVLAESAEELLLAPPSRLALPAPAQASLFVVVRGRVALRRASPAFEAEFGPGALVGGLAALGWHDPAVALEPLVPSLLLRLRIEDFFDVMEEHFDLQRSLMGVGALERERLANLAAQRRDPAR